MILMEISSLVAVSFYSRTYNWLQPGMTEII